MQEHDLRRASEGWDERRKERETIDLFWLFFAGIIIAVVLFVLFWPLGSATAQVRERNTCWDLEKYPNCRGFINCWCCCTKEACWEAEPGQFVQIDAKHWQRVSTGQIVEQTNWSPDGKFYVCTWDEKHKAETDSDGLNGYQRIGPQYDVVCLYPPLPKIF